MPRGKRVWGNYPMGGVGKVLHSDLCPSWCWFPLTPSALIDKCLRLRVGLAGAELGVDSGAQGVMAEILLWPRLPTRLCPQGVCPRLERHLCWVWNGCRAAGQDGGCSQRPWREEKSAGAGLGHREVSPEKVVSVIRGQGTARAEFGSGDAEWEGVMVSPQGHAQEWGLARHRTWSLSRERWAPHSARRCHQGPQAFRPHEEAAVLGGGACPGSAAEIGARLPAPGALPQLTAPSTSLGRLCQKRYI